MIYIIIKIGKKPPYPSCKRQALNDGEENRHGQQSLNDLQILLVLKLFCQWLGDFSFQCDVHTIQTNVHLKNAKGLEVAGIELLSLTEIHVWKRSFRFSRMDPYNDWNNRGHQSYVHGNRDAEVTIRLGKRIWNG